MASAAFNIESKKDKAHGKLYAHRTISHRLNSLISNELLITALSYKLPLVFSFQFPAVLLEAPAGAS